MLLVRTEDGWRFDEFRHASLDGAAFQWDGSLTTEYTYLGPGEYVGREYADARSKLILRHLDVINTPLDELPREILDELVPTGEEEHLLEEAPWMPPWLIRTYVTPHMVIQTNQLDYQMMEQLVEEGKAEDQAEFYEGYLKTGREENGGLDREFIYSIRLLDDTYPLETGLRVGDSMERLVELGYADEGAGDGTYGGSVGLIDRAAIRVEGGVVTEIEVYNAGRSCGHIFW